MKVAHAIHSLAPILFALSVCAPIAAREPASDALTASTARYNADRRRLVEENLELTESEAQRFWPVYDRFEQDHARIRMKRRELIAEFGRNYDRMSDRRARRLLSEHLALEEERVRLWKDYFGKFEEVLPIKKFARFYQIESKIHIYVDAGIEDELPLIK